MAPARGWLEVGVALLVALTFLGLALPRLDEPQVPLFDEVFHARSGALLARGLPPSEVSHPPLLKDAVAVSLALLAPGFEPRAARWAPGEGGGYARDAVWAWRLPSLLAAAWAVAVAYLLGGALGGGRAAGLAAAALLGLDGCFWVHARAAQTNVLEASLVLTAVGCAWRASRGWSFPWLLGAGVAIGLAVATRWSALVPWLALGAWLAWGTRGEARAVLRLAGAWVAVPLLVYVAAWLPVLATLHPSGLAGWGTALVEAQATAWGYHARLAEVHPYQSPWWSWPAMARPVWYHFSWRGEVVTAVWAIGNAVLWWASVPALIGALRAGWRGQPGLGLVGGLGLAAWVGWVIAPRSLTFMHYYLTVVPLAAIALGALGFAWWRGRALGGGAAPLQPGAARVVVIGAACAAVAWRVWYHPLLSAVPVSRAELLQRVWFGEAWL
ncbi:MAG: phospholipid carrier-dependent glycosyltransferase [Candidatus Sericytochromatia bacterium]|nr:phospholipid carrier-dependent glycosyltransferase [Candidatus Sericytochromatia bacterium]